jgi:hypothetical protein
MIGRAKIEHGKDAGRPDIGNIGATESRQGKCLDGVQEASAITQTPYAARRRFAAARAHETFETEH